MYKIEKKGYLYLFDLKIKYHILLDRVVVDGKTKKIWHW